MKQTRAGFLKSLFVGLGATAVASPNVEIKPAKPVLIAGCEILSMKHDGRNRMVTTLIMPSGIKSTFYSVYTGDMVRDADLFVVQLNRNLEVAQGWVAKERNNAKNF